MFTVTSFFLSLQSVSLGHQNLYHHFQMYFEVIHFLMVQQVNQEVENYSLEFLNVVEALVSHQTKQDKKLVFIIVKFSNFYLSAINKV